jgi:hypothetical protein
VQAVIVAKRQISPGRRLASNKSMAVCEVGREASTTRPIINRAFEGSAEGWKGTGIGVPMA